MKSSNSDASSSQQESHQTGQRWLEPRSMIVGGIAVAAIGLIFNWNWIVAVGVAPLLFTLPCMIMMGWMMWSMRPRQSTEDQPSMTTKTEERSQTQTDEHSSNRITHV
ncbi:hypothetical protein T31B1_17798 [Salinisphaera sp. T31B1]